jgi:phage terminase small subunit
MLWLEESDLPVARAWAEMEVLASQTYAALRVMGVINKQGEARHLLDDYRKLRQTQIVLARELGLTPAARVATQASGTRAALDLAAALASTEEAEVVAVAPTETTTE